MSTPSAAMSAPTLFVDRFTVLDFARFAPGGFAGESVYVHAEVDGALDEKGFLVDFGPVKKALKRVVDRVLDHRFAIPADYPVERAPGLVHIRIPNILDYRAPTEAFAFIPGGVDDARLCDFLAQEAMRAMPANVAAVRFRLEHEPELERQPSYRYTHGLKLHDGNCQRLIHGHRNIVEVFVDGSKSERGERELVGILADVHFAHADDLDVPMPVGVRGSEGLVRIAFDGSQGRFWAEMPATRVLPLNCEPTVENIATFARQWVSSSLNLNIERVAVRAYEGLHKGAQAGRR
ncbi:MAG: 6-carboxytetrahydropterin synthase [Myxococcota bacterium]